MSVDITVNETVNDVEIVVQPNVIEVNVTRTSGGGGGAVNSVNGQTGTVVLNADNIAETATRGWLTSTLKTAYDSASSWIITNGANLLNHLSNTSNPHSTTATQVDALMRDGSNANSDVDLGTFSLNAKAVKVNGTGGAGNVGLKHQSANATASTNETAIFAGSDGELYYKNDGNAVAQIASRAWVGLQGFLTSIPIATNLISGTMKLFTSTGTDTDGTMTQKAITDALNAKADSFYFYKIGTTSYVTGTTVETQVLKLEINPNTFSAVDILKVHRLMFEKVGTAGGFTARVKISTSSTMPSGTTGQIAIIGLTGATTLWQSLSRNFYIDSGNLKGFPFTQATSVDNSNTTTAVSSVAFDRTVTQYLYISITLANSADQVRLGGGLVSNI